jgi:hypothetical protein
MTDTVEIYRGEFPSLQPRPPNLTQNAIKFHHHAAPCDCYLTPKRTKRWDSFPGRWPGLT